MESSVSGLGRVDRERLAAIIRGTKGIVCVDDAARILGVSSVNAAKRRRSPRIPLPHSDLEKDVEALRELTRFDPIKSS